MKRSGHGTRPCGAPELLSTLTQSHFQLPDWVSHPRSSPAPLSESASEFVGHSQPHKSSAKELVLSNMDIEGSVVSGGRASRVWTHQHIFQLHQQHFFFPRSPSSLSRCLLFFSARPICVLFITFCFDLPFFPLLDITAHIALMSLLQGLKKNKKKRKNLFKSPRLMLRALRWRD